MSERHRKAKRLFAEACELPRDQQSAFLSRNTEGDEELRQELRRLLELDEESSQTGVDRFEQVAQLLGGLFATAPGPAVEESLSGDPRYRVRRKLGEGGMGVVYEAEQEWPRRTVALKVLRAGPSDPSLRRRFQLEAELLARLEHPGIARIYDAGTSGGHPFFAMECVRGPMLTVAAEALGSRERLELLAKVADAVDHAHQQGVVHRDLKPSNILVDEQGQPKVLDFGVARSREQLQGADSLRTTTGQLLGTLPYMAPEQAAGEPDLDHRADIYALGVLLYELMTGRRPLDVGGLPLQEALRQIRDVEPPPMGEPDTAWRQDVEVIAQTAMAKEPPRRYQSAAGFAEDLRRALRDEPILARPPTRLARLGRLARRHRAATASALGLLLMLCTATGISMVFARDASEARDAAQRDARLAESIRAFLTDSVLGGTDPRWGGRDLRVSEAVERGVRALREGRAPQDPELRASLLSSLGWSLVGLGRAADAAPLLRESYELFVELEGPEGRAVDVGWRLAQSLRGSNELDEAARLLERLAEQVRTRGEGSEIRLMVQEQQGHLATARGDWPAAVDHFRSAWKESERSLGAQSPRSRYLASQVVEVALELADWDGAEEALRAAERGRELGLPPMPHYGELALSRARAAFLRERGEFAAAAEAYAEIVERSREWLGVEAPIHIDALAYQAYCASSMGRPDPSLLERAHRLARQHLPADSGLALRVRTNRALDRLTAGDIAEARSELDACVETAIELDGPDSARVARIRALRARTRVDEDPAGACEELAAAQEQLFQRQGPSMRLAHERAQLAAWEYERGAFELAFAQYHRALEEMRQLDAPEHPWTGHVANLYALRLQDQGRLEEAEALLVRAMEEGYGGEDPRCGILVSGINLADSLGRQRRGAEAAEVWSRIEPLLEPSRPSLARRTERAWRAMAGIEREQGRLERAQARLERGRRVLEEIGEEPSIHHSLEQARLHLARGETDAARRELDRWSDRQTSRSGSLQWSRVSIECLRAEGREAEALALAERTAQLAVQWRAYRVVRDELNLVQAELHRRAGRLREALRLVEAVELAPEPESDRRAHRQHAAWRALVLRARVHEDRLEHEAADAAWEEALAMGRALSATGVAQRELELERREARARRPEPELEPIEPSEAPLEGGVRDRERLWRARLDGAEAWTAELEAFARRWGEARPQVRQARMDRARALAREQRWAAAEAQLLPCVASMSEEEAALALPRARARALLASILEGAGDRERAAEQWRRAGELLDAGSDPDHPLRRELPAPTGDR